MIVHRDDLIDMHRRIKECAIASPDAITVIILVALDTDAVAACAMLTVARCLCSPRAAACRVRREPAGERCAWLLPRTARDRTRRVYAPPSSVVMLATEHCPPLQPQKLLEQDEVSHKVKPVRDYGVLGDIFLNDIAEDAEVCRATGCVEASSAPAARWQQLPAECTVPGAVPAS